MSTLPSSRPIDSNVTCDKLRSLSVNKILISRNFYQKQKIVQSMKVGGPNPILDRDHTDTKSEFDDKPATSCNILLRVPTANDLPLSLRAVELRAFGSASVWNGFQTLKLVFQLLQTPFAFVQTSFFILRLQESEHRRRGEPAHRMNTARTWAPRPAPFGFRSGTRERVRTEGAATAPHSLGRWILRRECSAPAREHISSPGESEEQRR